MRRLQLSVHTSNFTRFWQIGTSIFPNLSLICNKKGIFLVLILESKELLNLKSHFQSIVKKLNNLLRTSSISDNELQFYEMNIDNYNSLFNQGNLNENKILKFKSMAENEFSKDINDIIIQDSEILKVKKVSSNSQIYQSNNLFKITLSLDKIDLNNNFSTTLRAILNITNNLIIGSCNYGKTKSIIIHLIGSECDQVSQTYQDLVQIITKSSQVSGKMRIINFKEIKKNPVAYSLGLSNSKTSNQVSLINLVNYIPQILDIS